MIIPRTDLEGELLLFRVGVLNTRPLTYANSGGDAPL